MDVISMSGFGKRAVKVCYLGVLIFLFATQSHAAFTYQAYIDTSYNYLLQKNQFTSGRFNRVFDQQENGFTLHQIGWIAAYLPEQGLGAYVNLIAGFDANVVSPSGWDPYFGSETLAMFPYDAYLQYRYETFTFHGGIMSTLAGIEENDSSLDYNFSRSLLDGAQPGTALGIRSIYDYNPQTRFYFGLGNGYSTFRNPLQLTLVELGVSYKPIADSSIALQVSNGPKQIVPGTTVNPEARFSLFDLVARYQVTDRILLAANADYFMQNKAFNPQGDIRHANWKGMAGYLTYKLAEQWSINTRMEVFDDEDGYVSRINQTLGEATVTLQYLPCKSVILRAETRRDVSNMNSYLTKNNRHTHNFQQSFGVEGIYLL